MAKATLTIPYQSLNSIELGSIDIDIDEQEVEVEIPDEVIKELVIDYLERNELKDTISRAVFEVLASGSKPIEEALRAAVMSVYVVEMGEDGKLADTIRRVLVGQVINEDGLISFKDSLTGDENVVRAIISQLQTDVAILELVYESVPHYYALCEKLGIEHDQASRVRDLFREKARLISEQSKKESGDLFDHVKPIGEETTE